ncbi:hypothetical protein BpHYR1_021079, partial [Brachionus plicatilis]
LFNFLELFQFISILASAFGPSRPHFFTKISRFYAGPSSLFRPPSPPLTLAFFDLFYGIMGTFNPNAFPFYDSELCRSLSVHLYDL